MKRVDVTDLDRCATAFCEGSLHDGAGMNFWLGGDTFRLIQNGRIRLVDASRNKGSLAVDCARALLAISHLTKTIKVVCLQLSYTLEIGLSEGALLQTTRAHQDPGMYSSIEALSATVIETFKKLGHGKPGIFHKRAHAGDRGTQGRMKTRFQEIRKRGGHRRSPITQLDILAGAVCGGKLSNLDDTIDLEQMAFFLNSPVAFKIDADSNMAVDASKHVGTMAVDLARAIRAYSGVIRAIQVLNAEVENNMNVVAGGGALPKAIGMERQRFIQEYAAAIAKTNYKGISHPRFNEQIKREAQS